MLPTVAVASFEVQLTMGRQFWVTAAKEAGPELNSEKNPGEVGVEVTAGGVLAARPARSRDRSRRRPPTPPDPARR